MGKIMNISDVQKDNETKYGKYARYKVEVETLENGELKKHILYLDEKQTEKDINLYVNNLKKSARTIHGKYLKKRFINNAILFGILIIEFFALTIVGNSLVGYGVSEIITSSLGTLIEVISGLSLGYYVNDSKFYYSKKEMEILNEIKEKILKSNDILGQIYKMKQQGKMFEYDYQRLNKDYEATRDRNRERNIEMKLQQFNERRERDARINNGITRKVNQMSKKNHSVNNVDFEYFKNTSERHDKTALQKNSSIKEIGQDIGELINRKKEEIIQSRYPENSFQRGEKRRR